MLGVNRLMMRLWIQSGKLQAQLRRLRKVTITQTTPTRKARKP